MERKYLYCNNRWYFPKFNTWMVDIANYQDKTMSF